MFKSLLPLRWIGHVPVDDFGKITLLDVEFTADFGDFRHTEVVPVLFVDFAEGVVVEQKEDGSEGRRTTFIGVPDRRGQPRGRRQDDGV